MVRYRDPIRAKSKTPGLESYPAPVTSTMMSSRTLPRPRPKSLVVSSKDIANLKKYKSVVTLKPSEPSSYYQRSYSHRTSPIKTTSPTHEALVRRRLSSSNAHDVAIGSSHTRRMTSSEYYSMSHSSESELEAWTLNCLKIKYTYIQFSNDIL